MAGQFSQLASVQQHLQKAFEYVSVEAESNLRGSLADADLEADSPIEAIFKLWWDAAAMVGLFRVRDLELCCQFIVDASGNPPYRLDFATTPSDTDAWLEGHVLGVDLERIGIEMDGHDFHERTKEQVIIRNQRDRDLQALGWQMLHFSGTELYKDPVAVVTEVARKSSDALNRFESAVRTKKRARGDYGR